MCAAALTACPEPPPTPSAKPPSGGAAVDKAAPQVADAPRFLKGQLHCHSNASGDSNTPPEQVARWYAEHDYDFIVFTDHNRITDIEGDGSMLVLPGVELTQNVPACSPEPEPGMQCLLHVNALVVDSAKSDAAAGLQRPVGLDRVDMYAHAVRVSEQLGGLSMLNHPNFHYAADARVIGLVGRRGLNLLEIANEAVDSNNQGDAQHPNTELLWDDVLASGARVWGTATDDAHHYADADAVRARGELAFEGDRGWVMVRSALDAASIREALRQGNFYSSTGVSLVDVRAQDGVLEVEVDSGQEHEIRFVGSGGRVLERVRGTTARFDLKETDSRYVRAVIQDDAGRKAWTQPLFKRDGGRT